ncbi:unnamed protein product [Urochloa humidicola]
MENIYRCVDEASNANPTADEDAMRTCHPQGGPGASRCRASNCTTLVLCRAHITTTAVDPQWQRHSNNGFGADQRPYGGAPWGAVTPLEVPRTEGCGGWRQAAAATTGGEEAATPAGIPRQPSAAPMQKRKGATMGHDGGCGPRSRGSSHHRTPQGGRGASDRRGGPDPAAGEGGDPDEGATAAAAPSEGGGSCHRRTPPAGATKMKIEGAATTTCWRRPSGPGKEGSGLEGVGSGEAATMATGKKRDDRGVQRPRVRV